CFRGWSGRVHRTWRLRLLTQSGHWAASSRGLPVSRPNPLRLRTGMSRTNSGPTRMPRRAGPNASYGRLLPNLLLFLLATCGLLLVLLCAACAPFRAGCAPLLAPFLARCAPLLTPFLACCAPLLAPLGAGRRSGLRSGLRGSGLLCHLLGCFLGRPNSLGSRWGGFSI